LPWPPADLPGITGKGTGPLNALLSTLSVPLLEAVLPSVVGGRALEVPGLHESVAGISADARLVVHAKLLAPRLGSLTDSRFDIDMGNAPVEASGTVTRANVGEASVGLGFGSHNHVGENPDGTLNPVESVNFITNGLDLRQVADDVRTSSGGASASKQPDLFVFGRMGVVEFDVEYRVVADLGGGRVAVRDVTVPGGVDLSVPQAGVEALLGKRIDGGLAAAQDAVHAAGQDWRKAEIAVDKARHEVQDLHLELERAAREVSRHEAPPEDSATLAAAEAAADAALAEAVRRHDLATSRLAEERVFARSHEETERRALEAELAALRGLESADDEISGLTLRLADARRRSAHADHKVAETEHALVVADSELIRQVLLEELELHRETAVRRRV
ncbi:hypothetical protein AB0G02_40985, partial [Actinosynnema sp. NPDC023658]|uniref:hypothetical protein n=1 Tax=Actinosynnema sp. NPDC023658 TaxID=3155465 RepID=UPI0033DCD1EB